MAWAAWAWVESASSRSGGEETAATKMMSQSVRRMRTCEVERGRREDPMASGVGVTERWLTVVLIVVGESADERLRPVDDSGFSSGGMDRKDKANAFRDAGRINRHLNFKHNESGVVLGWLGIDSIAVW
jgi:hypothetical protein